MCFCCKMVIHSYFLELELSQLELSVKICNIAHLPVQCGEGGLFHVCEIRSLCSFLDKLEQLVLKSRFKNGI